MYQRSIVLYLGRKGLRARETYNSLVMTLGHDAKGYRSVMTFLRQAKFLSPNPPTTVSEENASLDDSDETIFLALTAQPFASVHQLSRLTDLPRSTVYSQLTQSVRFDMII
jgi:hypothetical protein